MPLLVVVFLIAACGIARGADWPVFGHDPARSAVADDRTLNPRNVGTLSVRWRVALGEVADGSPIVVGQLLYQTRRDGTTVALDTVTGNVRWRFATPGSQITSSVPAYDATERSLYVPGVDGAVHKLDPVDGSEQVANGFPAVLTVSPETEKSASSLNLANGYLYAQTASFIGDTTPSVGHVVAVRLSDGVTHVFNALCSTQRTLIDPGSCGAQHAGLWSRAGVVIDPDPAMRGRIYTATGNANFDPKAGNYGDSILSLSRDATTLLGSLTPANYGDLEANDLDVGSSAPALLPRQPSSATPLLAVQGGKDATLRLFDRTRLSAPRALLQSVTLGAALYSAPAVWTDEHGTTFVYLGLADGVHAYRLTNDNRASRLEIAWIAKSAAANQGTSPVLDGGVVFFAASRELVALDAHNGRRLWSGPIGPTHWQSPAIANGVVYCSDNDGELTAFALPDR